MSTINYLTVRNTILPVVNAVTANYSTLTGSTITATSMNLTSATISLGASTNQTYNNFSNGSYLTWATAKSAMTSANKTVQSANGLYQMIVANATSGLFLSSDSGITWSTLTGGLPTLTGSAYWSDGAISANGQYITLSIYGGSLWMSADYGRTFALTNQPTPSIWLPLNGNTTDSMGLSVVTTPGTVPGYVTLNYPGYTAQAVNLANTAGGTATRYVRGTWTGSPNFTVSLWFNAQTVNGTLQPIFEANYSGFGIFINTNNVLYFQFPNGGASGNTQLQTQFTLSVNTWYYVTAMFQTNGLCSFYVNNTLIASSTNTGGVGAIPSSGFFGVGTFDTVTTNAFNGYVDDVKITHSVSTYVPIPLLQPNIWLPFENTAGDLGSYSLPPSATPLIYLPFEGNVTDSMSFSTVTTPGTVPGYVPVNREGYTGQAVNLLNTAGSTATRYIRGTWSAPANFTVSFWMNPQTISSVYQYIFSVYSGAIQLFISNTNVINCAFPTGTTTGQTVVSTSYAAVVNTWYYITVIFQTNGLCSLYVNNALAGTMTNGVGGYGTFTQNNTFGLGTYDNAQNNCFNGYIDDLRIYNSAIPFVPLSVVTVGGSLSYVPGVVGLNAVNLVNTAGGTATNFIYSSWSGSPNFTISGWFNTQALAPGGYQVIFCSYNFGLVLYINPSNQLALTIPSGGAGLGLTVGPTSYTIATNTWYHFIVIFQTNGLCSLYVNNALIGSATNVSGVGTFTVSQIALGRYDVVATSTNAFNGYIDDFRLYNAAIPIHQLLPQNYRSLALSGTGQYALASAASGWVVGSSDSSKTWSKQAVCVGTQNGFIQPNLSGLGANTWIANGVTWTASANAANLPAYNAFNNNFTTGNNWLGQLGPGQYNASGVYTGTASTTILGGIGSIGGEWVQIQSSVPLILSNYSYAVGGKFNQPKTMYIVGSADGLTNWYPLQLHVLAANPFNTDFTAASTYIVMNYTGNQTVTAQTSQTVTTTSYASTTQAFTYFRFIINTNFLTSVDCGALGELYLNFVRPLTNSRPPTHALSLNHTGQYQMVATGPAAGSIMPNLTGLVTNTWSQGGVNWTASASSVLSSWFIYKAFNNITGDGWLSDNVTPRYTTGSPNGNAALTNIQTIGSTAGEWLQIQSSVPMVMNSYALGIGPNAYPASNTPKTFYIVGSNDGSTWYPIHYGNLTVSAFTGTSVSININTTGTQTLTTTMVGSIATTAYSFSTNAYTYFRMIGTSLLYTAAGGSYMEVGEWFINFQNSVSYSSNYGSTWLNTSSTVSNESVALSSSGQYALSTNSVAPFARLTLDNTNVDAYGILVPATGAGTVTYSTSIKTVGTHSGQFVNTAGGTPSVYLNYTVPTALNTPSTLTMACWVYPSTYGVASNSYFLNLGSTTQYGCSLGFNASGEIFNYTGKTSGGTQQTMGAGVAPLNTWTHVAMTYNANLITLYVNGVVTAQSAIAGNLSLVGGGNITNLLVGCSLIAQALNGYVDDVRIYTSALTATAISTLYNNPTITQSQIVAVSNSYLPITSYTFPALTGIGTATVVDTAVSQTGQYMVAVTSSTTNNVYYSTDYGATFTALTVGTSAMVSCSISYDGSYLTATNATTTFTLNRNTRGFSVTVGNQAGLINQAQNAIAIGDKAGRTNQSANSIVLNASGNALDAVAPGFYVSPVATTTSSNATSFALLGYGTDSQVTQTNLTVLSNGNVGLGTVAPNFPLDIWGGAVSITSSGYTPYLRLQSVFGAAYLSIGSVFGINTYIGLQCGVTTTSALGTPTLVVTNNNNVGIGTDNPATKLDVAGTIRATTGILITGSNVLEFGHNVPKGNASGRIGYQTFTASTLDIVGAGVANDNRNIKLWDNVQVAGTISKAGGTFDIGHPLYPDTSKRLVHSFIEGPRCDLIYRGKTTLVDGSAVVNIDKECTHSPECAMDEGTFEALCDNPQIFLQNNQSFDRVRGVISGATLTITCENPASVEIEWMVIAERADPFIKKWDRTNPDGYLITQYTSENNIVEPPSQ